MTTLPGAAADLDHFLRPRSIAIVGFSSKPQSASRACYENLRTSGFPGEVHLVGRSGGEIDGLSILPSLELLPADVDLALFMVPAAGVKDAVAEAVQRRVKAGVIFAAGFAEMGEEARRAQDEIADIAKRGGLLLLGPNCLGYSNFSTSLNVSFLPQPKLRQLPPGTRNAAAIVMQSGGLMGHVYQTLLAKGAPVAYRVSTGNEVGVELADFVAAFAGDAAVATVVVYAEHIRTPARFLDAVRQCRSVGKHVVLLHPGRGDRAKRAAASHTGALAGDYSVMATQVAAAGALLVETLEELVDTAELLVRFPVPPVDGVAVITSSGAICAHANDCCEQLDLAIPAFSEDISASLKQRMPEFVEVDNPVDLTTQAVWDLALTADCTALALSDQRVGSACLILPYGNPDTALRILERLVQVPRDRSKPMILTILGDEIALAPEYLALVREAGFMFLRSGERALRTLAAVTRYGRQLALAERAGAAVTLPAVPTVPPGACAEWEGKRILADIGIPVGRGELAADVEQAAEIARGIGYPVAMKLQSRQLTHKTEVGGVLLNIGGEDELRAAWATLVARAGSTAASIDGVLVERMAPKGLELMVGAKRDPAWGPVVMVGIGGIWVEALNDVRLLPAQAAPARVAAELRKLKTEKLLGSFRGAPARDVAAVADVVSRVGQLMLECPQIEEIDINPLLVLGEGEGVLALDALLVAARHT